MFKVIFFFFKNFQFDSPGQDVIRYPRDVQHDNQKVFSYRKVLGPNVFGAFLSLKNQYDFQKLIIWQKFLKISDFKLYAKLQLTR